MVGFSSRGVRGRLGPWVWGLSPGEPKRGDGVPSLDAGLEEAEAMTEVFPHFLTVELAKKGPRKLAAM